MINFVRLAVATTAIAVASPAMALPTIIQQCRVTDITPDATECSGWFSGNLLSGNGQDKLDQAAALALIGFTWDKNWSAVEATKVLPTGDNQYNFAGLLNGDTWIGIHRGGSRNGTQDMTGFFRLTADNLDYVALDFTGGSTGVVYKTGGVPEPATWAMLIVGFGLVGAAMRRRRMPTTVTCA